MGSKPKKIKLKRCPFCGGQARIGAGYRPFNPNGDGWKIHCGSCGLSTQVYTRLADAVRRWNTRVVSDDMTVFVNVDGVYVERVKEEKNDNIPC